MSASMQADLRPRLSERDRDVDADRALADAALARRDRDDVLHVLEHLLALARGGAADHRSPGDLDAGRADPDEGGPRVALDLVLEGQAGVVSSIVRATLSPSITTSLTMLRVTMSRPSSGSWTVRRTSKMAPSERVMRLVGPRRRVAVPNIDGDCVDMANPSAIGRRGPRCESDGTVPTPIARIEPLIRDARHEFRIEDAVAAEHLGVLTPFAADTYPRPTVRRHGGGGRRAWQTTRIPTPYARPAGRGRVPREKS